MPLAREANTEPISGYRLIEPLGTGGFGEVWKCEAPGGLFKAIKFVNGNLDDPESEGLWAEQELKALERVKAVRHPFVLTMERVEIIDGELLIVMELADRNLHDRLVECQAGGLPGIPREELLSYLRDAAEALDLMNGKHDLQHLDIKPRNLFLVSNRVKVADFGLVKGLEGMTTTSPTTGLMGGVTPLYASPETFQGIISRHSDQYSLAIVYQELLCGRLPFNGKNARQLAIQHVKEDPDVSPLAAAERPIVTKALAKDPKDRFANCMAFVRALVSGQIPETKPAPARNGAAENVSDSRLGLGFELDELFLSPVDANRVFKRPDEQSPTRLSPEEAAELSVTVAQPLRGSLKPTLVLGLGSFGRLALQALRCRFIDRFDSLSKLPLFRFLYIDTDPTAIKEALHGPPEQALTSTETHHVPLQGIAHYRRNRQALENMTEWIPMEKLYAIPRSLETQGSRALGRLALADNYLRVAARLKRELQLIGDPDNTYQSVKQSGLPLRSDVPQVYILAAAGGGSGSGMMIDLAYTVRRLLHDMKHPDAEVVAFLLCGAPNDPAMPAEEQANLYATLTEINHFSDAAVAFAAQFGGDGPVLREQAPPFQACYLIKMDHRSPEGVQQSASRIASYIFHDLSTPLGVRLGQSRDVQRMAGETPFRSFGTYAVWYPRGLVLRMAARRACQQLIGSWQTECAEETLAETDAYCDRVLGEGDWSADCLRQQIDDAATTDVDGTPGQALTAFLATLEAQSDQAVARDDPAGWCRQAVERVREWVGSGISAIEETSEWRKSRLHRVFSGAIQKIADQYIEVLSKAAHLQIDQPGYRLYAADAALAHFIQRCDERINEQELSLREIIRKTEQSWQQVDLSVQACLTGNYGGFSLFGGNRLRKVLRAFVDRLSGYARQRLAEESARSVQHFYSALVGRLHELRRDLSFCQQRLRHLEQTIGLPGDQDALPDGVGDSGLLDGAPVLASSSRLLKEAAQNLASRIVLPEGVEDLDEAANWFLAGLAAEHWGELDVWFQEKVLAPLGGLHHVCITTSDLSRSLGGALLKGAVEYLSQQLPVTDVSEAELSAAQTLQVDLGSQARAFYALAEPSIHSNQADREQAFLLVPSSDAGKQLGEIARQAVKQLHVVRTLSQTDLLFCREQAQVGLHELRRLLERCKSAYIDHSSIPVRSPHARSDILDWIPLDP